MKVVLILAIMFFAALTAFVLYIALGTGHSIPFLPNSFRDGLLYFGPPTATALLIWAYARRFSKSNARKSETNNAPNN